MSRGISCRAVRCSAVWLTGSVLALGSWRLGLASARALLTTGGTADFDELLVGTCAVALLATTTWLWCVVTATVVGLLRGRVRGDGLVRRLVLAACGAAVVASLTSPAGAAEERSAPGTPATSTASLLTGLPMPERASAPAPTSAHPDEPQAPGREPQHPDSGTGVHVVSAGESLWSIAAGTAAGSTAGTDDRALDRAWRRIWAANRSVIGADPDLIRPGQRLRVPPVPDEETQR